MIFDCLKGLIGFSDKPSCLGEAPEDMKYTPESGVYLDKHAAFKAMIVQEISNFWTASYWPNIIDADAEARRQLGLDLVKLMRTKVDAINQALTVEIGESRGGGYHSTYTIPASLEFSTKNVPEASYVMTHLGWRGTLLTSSETVSVRLLKNGTLLKTFTLVCYNNTEIRVPLLVPEELALDGSTYTLAYSYNANMFPVKNDMDCGCPQIQSGYQCFFVPFKGDAGGLRVLGEVRCNETIWPCQAVQGGLAGLSAAKAYQSMLVLYLLQNLVTMRRGKPNAFTLIKAEDIGPTITELQAEYGSYLADFATNWGPSPSCCYEVKTKTFVASGL